MASNNSYQQRSQCGNPPVNSRLTSQNMGRENPPQARQPRRMRPRDIDRMSKFNQRQHEKQFGQANWVNQVEIAENEEEARSRPQPQQRTMNKRPVRRPPPIAPKITTETPPKDEQLYTGNGRGSKPVKKTLGQNFDCAGFIPLVRQTYDRLCIEDQRLPRSMPYAIFQHAMVEFLVAYQLHQAKFVLKSPVLQSLMDPLSAISAEDYNIPQPIFEYICGFGPSITPTGDKVFWNLPTIAIPQETFTAENVTARPGTFGPATPENHNAYECYISPYITSQYIKLQAMVTPTTRSMSWHPLPRGWYPANCDVTENLLGYRPLERLHPDALRKLAECDFDETDTISGRLCHCPYALNLVSGTLGVIKDIKIVKANFKPKENSAAFIYKSRTSTESENTCILWDAPSTLCSPFSFSAAASNRANYMAYKRKRDERSPGTCYLCNGEPPDGWVDTRNHNFNCEGNFALQLGFRDRPNLRDVFHEEEEGEGTVTQDVFIWLDTTLVKR